jgi:hypothetical protein
LRIGRPPDVAEAGAVQRRQLGIVGRHPQAQHQQLAHEATRVVVAVEADDLAHGLVDVLGDAVQRHVVGIDQPAVAQVRGHVLLPVPPVVPPRRVHEHHRHDLAASGLDQRQRLEALVVGAEAAREQRDRVGLLHEHQLAGEEVPEVDQLGVAVDDRVRPLLVGQPDVDAEGRLPARPALRRLHDPPPAPVITIQPARTMPSAKRSAGHPVRRAGRRARAAEDGDLAHVLPRREHAEGVAQLLVRVGEELQVGGRGAVARASV